MKLKNLEDLFLHELKDIYDAEKRLLKALPKMAKNAESPELKQAFENHAAETEEQVARLEEVFRHLEKPAKGKKCEAMVGLIEEGKSLMEEDALPAVLEAGMIAAAQKVEHYEIAVYGTLATWAKMLGHDQILNLLKLTIEEEKKTDKLLTDIASKINFEAEEAEEQEAARSR